MNAEEIAWFAGIFEGEGYAGIAKNGGTRLQIGMTDRDIIERVHAMFPANLIWVKQPPSLRADGRLPKLQYTWRISRPDQVREILTLILPWLGERRSARAREVLHHLDTRIGNGGHQRNKTHCAEGHEYTPENTYLRPGTTHRHCRICRNEWSKQSQRRKRAAAKAAKLAA